MNVFQVHWHNAFVHNSKESSVPMFAQCFLPRSDRDARKVLDQPRDQPGDCVDNSWSAGQDYYLWSSFRSRTARCWSRSTVRACTSSTPLMWWVMWSFNHMDGDFKQWSYSWWIHLMISSMTLTPRWQQRFTRLCCLVWSLRSSLGITPSRARRTMRTACPVSSSSSASLRMEGVSQRSCKYDREPSSSSRLWLNNNFQVFSRQAVQMDALISAFVDEIKQVSVNNWSLVDLCLQRAAMYAEDGDGNIYNDNSSTEADGKTKDEKQELPKNLSNPDCLVPLTTVSRRGIPESCLSNKLSRWVLSQVPQPTCLQLGNLTSESSTHFCFLSSFASGWPSPLLTTRATASATWAPGVSPPEHSTNITTQTHHCLDHSEINFEPQRHLEICCCDFWHSLLVRINIV